MNDFVAAGYFVARVERADLAGLVASASGCISAFLPDTWCIEWTGDAAEEREKKAAVFGIPPEGVAAVTAWATQAFSNEFGWPNAFYTLERARAARRRFVSESSGSVLFGLGLHESQVDSAGVADTAGVFECLQRRQRMARGGETVGFELLSTDKGILTCSWLCNGLETLCAEQLGIVRNARGLVGSYADSVRCAELISQPETGAEPGLWQPWLVVVY